VVERVRSQNLGPDDPVEPARCDDVDAVDLVGRPVQVIVTRSAANAQVLDQGAAVGDVQQLGPPTDAEDGHPRRPGRSDEGQLPVVAQRIRRAALRLGDGPVPSRVDVAAAGEDQTVDPRHG